MGMLCRNGNDGHRCMHVFICLTNAFRTKLTLVVLQRIRHTEQFNFHTAKTNRVCIIYKLICMFVITSCIVSVIKQPPREGKVIGNNTFQKIFPKISQACVCIP